MKTKIRNSIVKRFHKLALEALKKIWKLILSNYFKRQFKKGVFFATIYVENEEIHVNPYSRV